MSIDWETLVEERDKWVAKNFPDSYKTDTLLGVVEELGELAHAHLKSKQGIRGTQSEHDEAAKDAIGDLVVYLLGVISYEKIIEYINYEEISANFHLSNGRELALFDLAAEVGGLCSYVSPSGPRGLKETIAYRVNRILALCSVYCEFRYWNFEDIVTKTWDHVKQRDWNKHREDGAPKEDPKMKDPEVQRIEAEAQATKKGYPQDRVLYADKHPKPPSQ
jgi:NTP pyrophosphatase (non-canonical NTP hydrolase)